jgi:hypothetical protein
MALEACSRLLRLHVYPSALGLWRAAISETCFRTAAPPPRTDVTITHRAVAQSNSVAAALAHRSWVSNG